jgi:hypothetical protein
MYELEAIPNQGFLISFDSSGLISPKSYRPGKVYWSIVGNDTLAIRPFLVTNFSLLQESRYKIEKLKDQENTIWLHNFSGTSSLLFAKQQ